MKVLDFIIGFGSRGQSSLVNSVSQIQQRLDSANGAAMRLTQTVGSGLKNAFMSLPGAQFFTNPVIAISAGIGTVSKLGMQAEKTAKSFDVLVGSASMSSSMLSEINKYADNTLWSRMDATNAAQSLLAYSVPAEKVVDDLKMLGDISLGDANRMSTLASVFGQISTAGKLMTQDYKQLLNVGFNPLYDISQMTGKSIATLQDEMSKGKISFEMFEQAVVHATSAGGKYHDMIESLASTTSGTFEQVKGSFTATLLEIYNLIQPMVSSVLKGLNALLTGIKQIIPILSDISPLIAGITAAVAAYNVVQLVSNNLLKGFTITEGIHYMWLLLVEKAQWLLNAAMSANPIGLVIALVVGLVTAITICWNKFEGFRAVILTVWDTVKGFGNVIKTYLIDRITGFISGIGTLGKAISKLFKGDFEGAWESAKEGAMSLTGMNAVKKAASGTSTLIGGIKSNYDRRLADEKAKKVTAPSVPGVADTPLLGAAAYGGSTTKNAETITTGGTRNTSINMTISKFFDNMNISMENSEDDEDLQDKMVEYINRALEIALSAAR